MGLSRSARISLLLVIDTIFFLVELIVGYAVGSLALIGDSYHMLNDVLSMAVALYAIKLTALSATNDSRYTYGWHRAEILAALVNGVFLLALCFSIFLEALQRFFNPEVITNPKLIVVVGSLGLASNILGLFLFHEHGHSTGASASSSKAPSIASIETTPVQKTAALPAQSSHSHGHTRSPSHGRSGSESFSPMYGHPAATRASLVQVAQDMADVARSPSMDVPRPSNDISPVAHKSLTIDEAVEDDDDDDLMSPGVTSEQTPLLLQDEEDNNHHGHSHTHGNDHSHEEEDHSHSHGGGGGLGHSHVNMNMHALLLHVLGDALGNVGVIATGLIVWLTPDTFTWKIYCDPIISLFITVIIFSSALPLVRSASFILLQGVPADISAEQVRAAILKVDGVLSLHELHIWQLSESKVIASVHVTASRSHEFMPVAADIRKVLHLHGIHSSTIQPEYHPTLNAIPDESLKTSEDTSCLILCPPAGCDPAENACCPPSSTEV